MGRAACTAPCASSEAAKSTLFADDDAIPCIDRWEDGGGGEGGKIRRDEATSTQCIDVLNNTLKGVF